MNITVLSANLFAPAILRALAHHVGSSGSVVAIANTTHDITMHGLRVCPDIDNALSDITNAPAHFTIDGEIQRLGPWAPWFPIPDAHYPTHIVRNQLLDLGYTLSQVTQVLHDRWQPPFTVRPLSDQAVETHLVVKDADSPSGTKAVHYQQWLGDPQCRLEPPTSIVSVGLDKAVPAPEVNELLRTADVVVIPPCDPVITLGTMLSLQGIRDVLQLRTGPVLAVSPFGVLPADVLAHSLATVQLPAAHETVLTLFGDCISDLLIPTASPTWPATADGGALGDATMHVAEPLLADAQVTPDRVAQQVVSCVTELHESA